MNKMLVWSGSALAIFFLSAAPLMAQVPGGTQVLTGKAIAAGLGAGITLIGAGIGFGKIGAAALESMARQPEVAGQVGTNMMIVSAFLEGATFFSLIVCIIMAGGA